MNALKKAFLISAGILTLASCKKEPLTLNNEGIPVPAVDKTPKPSYTKFTASTQTFGTDKITDANATDYSYTQQGATKPISFSTGTSDTLKTSIKVFSKGIAFTNIAQQASLAKINGTANIDSTVVTVENLKTNKTGITTILPASTGNIQLANKTPYTGNALSVTDRVKNFQSVVNALPQQSFKINN